jgi:hypothetical protein
MDDIQDGVTTDVTVVIASQKNALIALLHAIETKE